MNTMSLQEWGSGPNNWDSKERLTTIAMNTYVVTSESHKHRHFYLEQGARVETHLEVRLQKIVSIPIGYKSQYQQRLYKEVNRIIQEHFLKNSPNTSNSNEVIFQDR